MMSCTPYCNKARNWESRKRPQKHGRKVHSLEPGRTRSDRQHGKDLKTDSPYVFVFSISQVWSLLSIPENIFESDTPAQMCSEVPFYLELYRGS